MAHCSPHLCGKCGATFHTPSPNGIPRPYRVRRSNDEGRRYTHNTKAHLKDAIEIRDHFNQRLKPGQRPAEVIDRRTGEVVRT